MGSPHSKIVVSMLKLSSMTWMIRGTPIVGRKPPSINCIYQPCLVMENPAFGASIFPAN